MSRANPTRLSSLEGYKEKKLLYTYSTMKIEGLGRHRGKPGKIKA